jgi:TNF receptor-associated protein 1
MAPEQEDIYYLMAPDRGLATASPYYEGLKQSGREVLFVYNPIDEFVMSNLKLFNGRKLVSAEAADVPDAAADADEDAASAEGALTAAEAAVLCGWMKDALPDRLKEVKASGRLVSHPAMVTGHESASLRNMMRMVNQQNSGDKSISGLLPPQVLEINGKHEIVKRLHGLVDKGANAELCKAVSEQLVDNALISAGLIDDSRVMLPRLNGMLELVLGSASGVPDPVVAAEAPAPPAAAEASEAAPDADAAAAPSSSSK